VIDSAHALPVFYGDEHRALATKMANAIAPSGKLRAHGDADVDVAANVVPWLAREGLAELVVPRGRASVRALCVAREALAYVSPLADAIFAVHGLGAQPMLIAGTRGDVLEEMRAGTRVGGFALTEPEAGSDVASMRATARRDGDAWVLDGEKVFISNVGIAHSFVVFANADPSQGKRGISAFFVDAKAPGLTLTSIATSGDHPLGRLTMRACRVGADALVGEVGHGMRLALGTLDVFRTSVGAAAVGMAQRALDEALGHVARRVQFGQPLADFQLVQATLAEMATELDAARLLVARAAWLKDTESKSTAGSTAVAMAKLYATEAAQRIIDRAVQLHGGLGVTAGAVVERLYREIRPLRIYEGTSEIQKLIIGSALAKQAKESRPA
jgi:acyl-CoA dehydrogenase